MRSIVAVSLFAATAACAGEPSDQDTKVGRGAEIRARIAKYESSDASKQSLNFEIRKVTYRGKPAYLFMSPCCDQFNFLYDPDGKALCAPSGGIAGSGDGRCPEVMRPERPK